MVKTEFLHHFSKRFAPFHGPPTWLGVDLPNRISRDEADGLETPFMSDEIKRAVWDCGDDRAPGPDGFSFAFIKYFWYLIEPKITRLVAEFFHSSHFPKGCISSFIALIPKISDPKHVSDFRPISLIGCQYKIIGKFLANRLSGVIDGCVSREQSAFIKGHNILDGPMILNEVMRWHRKMKRKLMVFKVDFEKAFDSLR